MTSDPPMSRQQCLAQLNTLLHTEELRNLVKLARNKRPAVTRILRDVFPEEEPTGPYITYRQERERHVRELRRLTQDPRCFDWNSTALGVIMTMEIEKLREWMRQVRTASDPVVVIWTVKDILCSKGPSVIYQFLEKGEQSPETPRSHSRTPTPSGFPSGTWTPLISEMSMNLSAPASPTTPGRRSASAKKKCLERDGGKCVITGTEQPEVAYIFPFSASQSGDFDNLYWLLRCMAGPQRAEELVQMVSDRNRSEHPKNLIAKNRQLHHWWTRAMYGLKPLPSANPNERRVQFHWMKPSSFSKTELVLGDDFMQRAGLDTDTWGDNKYAHRKSGLPLETGQVFVIKADDPEDLPDDDFLKLQWDLVRIAAIAGGGEASDDYFSPPFLD